MAPGGPARRAPGPGLGWEGWSGRGAAARRSRRGVGRQRRRDASTCRETSLSIGGGSAPTLRSETGCGNDAIHARRMRRFTAVSDDAAREPLALLVGRDIIRRRERPPLDADRRPCGDAVAAAPRGVVGAHA